MSEFDTKPTIETLLEEMKKGFAAMKAEFDQLHDRLISLESRFDRQEDKVDIFVREILDMKRALKHPV